MSNLESNTYQPLVSVALATYNGEKFLREQLDSLLNQTYRNIEIIISDDNSTDNTQLILREYANRDSRVKWSLNKRERGFVNNFSEAITRSVGEVIFLCDQDDVWNNEKIKKHIDAYQDQSIMWAYNEIAVTDENRKITGYLTDTMPDYWTRRNLLYYTWGSCVLGCATSYRARLIKDIWPADRNAPGHDSWIQLVIYPAKSSYLNEVLQEYRQHNQNTVGLKTVSESEIKEREKKAVENNINYLNSLILNHNVQLWKRLYFSLVLLVKIIRRYIKR